MKRVAIPVTNNELSEFFGTCNHYEIFEIDGEGYNKKSIAVPLGTAMSELPEWLEEQGINDVIAYKVSREIITLFASKKVNLFIGVAKGSPESLIDNYLQGTLESDKKIIDEITK